MILASPISFPLGYSRTTNTCSASTESFPYLDLFDRPIGRGKDGVLHLHRLIILVIARTIKVRAITHIMTLPNVKCTNPISKKIF